MSFSSIIFIFIFLPISVILYYLIPVKYRHKYLLIISLLFYLASGIRNLIILISLILFNFYATKKMDKLNHKNRKLMLWFIIVVNVFLIFYYKYYFPFLSLITSESNFKKLVAPLGLSFYLFTILSYVIDVYKKKIKCEQELLPFALYISFFPKLLMGPIVRYSSFRKELKKKKFNEELFHHGFKRFILGLSMKCILADTFSRLIASYSSSSTIGSIFLLIFYSLQIYYDFAGYINMALGISNLFGYTFEENFTYPYTSKSVSEFWNRWHITLGKWFKNYIYIPLGGNRKGPKRLILNILIVWLLTGIWHGATFNYILWGLYFGLIIIIEKLWLKDKKIPNFARILITLILVSIGWLIFFNKDYDIIFNNLKHLIIWNKFIDKDILFILKNNYIYIIVGLIMATPLIRNIGEIIKKKNTLVYNIFNTIYLCGLFILSISFIISNSYNTFLYFNF